MRIALTFMLSAAMAAAQAPNSQRQLLEYTRSHYTKYEYRIPMRDGAHLFTAIYVPKDDSHKYPIMLERTPYSVGPYGVDNYRGLLGPSEQFTREGFIFAYQDVRGRYLSEGTFVDMRPHRATYSGSKDIDESTDTYDTIDWLVKNISNNNGRVGQWGISYPGFYTAHGMISAHPALKASSPQAPMGDVGNGDDAYHFGAFFLAANFGFFTGFTPRPEPARPQRRLPFDYGTPDQYEFYLNAEPLSRADELYFKGKNEYWTELLKHTSYDQFWRERALSQWMKKITPAVLLVGGWFDAEDLGGTVKMFRALEENQPDSPETFVMGPWSHGGWSRGDGEKLGDLHFNVKTAEYFRNDIEFPFFMYHLKAKGDGKFPKAWVFETGTDRWVKFDAWPPRTAKQQTLYFEANGRLSFTPPASQSGYDEYVSDPAHPVPVSADIGGGMPGDYMTYDQRFASRRPDVLTYITEPLDRDITVAGPVSPELNVSTSGTDSDFVIKLIDVYPADYPEPEPRSEHVHMAGYQQLVRGEPFRGKFRNGMDKPEPFTPNKPAKVEYVMPDVCHTFRPGHRIMVQIQSSWFPLTDLNPQKFLDIPNAKRSDFQKATERIYRGSGIRILAIE
ncbi:MAG TPA: CocE/NonD family hydrolase [Bryobacteraceae bacterium]|nr:CocE/NonD family hydrolase [Bryobacteraceae bacterium]